jgi:hypothetical protein
MAKKTGRRFVPDDEVQEDLIEFERLMRILRAEYNQFFVGALKGVPEFTQGKIRRLIKKYQGGDMMRRSTDRYRFFNLVARFNANLEMWGKRVRLMEGRDVFGRQSTQGLSEGRAAAHQEERRRREERQPKTALKYSTVLRDPDKDRASVQGLFERYQQAARETGKDTSKLTEEKFQRLLKKQAELLKQKTGAQAVKFSLRVENGEVRLTAKSVKK